MNAWFQYYMPGIPMIETLDTQIHVKSVYDFDWIFECASIETAATVAGSDYALFGYLTYQVPHSGTWWGVTVPEGQVPPLAQLIANGSLWTKYPQFAAFIGLPSPDPELQQCVASYFHIPYTPVATTTTTTITTTATTTAASTMTTTVTSTITSTTTTTVTTTAVSTVTVTKPVISTALVVGIVVIVVIIAAVAAVIALRRR